ncbi:kinase-like domain-containing protein [Rhizophagus clarus]|uniref:Kinase-like domain-containing protein n=1 Tax=Rhizophagus clarus TaxID=94130 RepID=A0A8H3M6V2_9GLOM|nr:kinase-like domain-containing protein [Rhizophagus clarus]
MSSFKYNRYETYARFSSLLEKFLEQEFGESDYSCHEDIYDKIYNEKFSLPNNSSYYNYNYNIYINKYSPSCNDSKNYLDINESNIKNENLDSVYECSSIGEDSEESDDNFDSSTEKSEDDIPEDLRDLLRFYNEWDDDDDSMIEDDFDVDRQFDEEIKNDKANERTFMLKCDIRPSTSDGEDNIVENDIKKGKFGAIRHKLFNDMNAAENGSKVAQYDLDYCYKNGKGTQKDGKNTKSADKGIFKLGNCYELELKLTKKIASNDLIFIFNKEEAIRLYDIATKGGNGDGQKSLAFLFEYGEGTEKI